MTTLDNPFNKFYRQHFLAVVLITITRYFKDSFVRKHIGERMGHINNALKALLSKGNNDNSKPDEKVRTLIPPRLLAIAVDDRFRGLGIANELTRRFCAELRTKGFEIVGLSALPWNKRALGFY